MWRLFLAAALIVTPLVGLGGLRASTPARASNPRMPLTPYPTPAPTLDPKEVFTVVGGCWLDAKPCDSRLTMTAKIGDTVCATASARPNYGPTVTEAPYFGLAVPSNEIEPGCGFEGAVVTFFAGDQEAAQTAAWHGGTTRQEDMNFTVGPPFAHFIGNLDRDSLQGNLPSLRILPSVGETQCGVASIAGWGTQYEAEIPSAEQSPGCGTEGAEVTFKLVDGQGNVVSTASQTGVWHKWDGIWPGQSLDLTFSATTGMSSPNVGTSDGARHDVIQLTPLAAVVCAAGVVAIVASLALRRRKATK